MVSQLAGAEPGRKLIAVMVVEGKLIPTVMIFLRREEVRPVSRGDQIHGVAPLNLVLLSHGFDLRDRLLVHRRMQPGAAAGGRRSPGGDRGRRRRGNDDRRSSGGDCGGRELDVVEVLKIEVQSQGLVWEREIGEGLVIHSQG